MSKFGINLGLNQKIAIRNIADEMDVSMSDVIRRAVDHYINTRVPQFSQKRLTLKGAAKRLTHEVRFLFSSGIVTAVEYRKGESECDGSIHLYFHPIRGEKYLKMEWPKTYLTYEFHVGSMEQAVASGG